MVITTSPMKYDRRQPSKGSYDAIVYIDGSQIIAEDSNGRKIASGVAGTDLVTVWNSLIAGIPEYSTIILDGLDETISTSLYANVNGLKIQGINGARITTSGTAPAIWIGSTSLWKTAIDLLPTTNLTANIGPSDVTEFVDGGVHEYWYTVIPVVDPSIVAAGDWILLASNVVWTYTERSTYPNEGELFRVLSVGASDITVIGAAHDTYSVSDGAKIIKVPMIQDVELRDMDFIGTDTAYSYGVISNFVYNMKMSNIHADLFSYAAIAIFNNVASIFDSLWFNGGFQSGAGYGLEILNSCQDLNISNVHGNEKRHVITAGSSVYGIPRRINITNCTATNGYENAAFDAHHCSEFVQYNNLVIDNCPIAIKASGVGSSWSNIKATNINGYGISTGGLQGAADLLWPSNIYRNFDNIEIHFGTFGSAFNSQLRCHQMNMHNIVFDGLTTTASLRDFYKSYVCDCSFIPASSFTNHVLRLFAINNAISDVEFIRCRFPGARDATRSASPIVIKSSALSTQHDADFKDCYFGDICASGVHLYDGNSSVADILLCNCVGPTPIITKTSSWTYTIRDGSIGRYLTYNFGSETGTGSEQTIAHGLAAIPTGCKAWITYLVGTRYVTEMIPFDATNVYPTVDNGVAYAWRIE